MFGGLTEDVNVELLAVLHDRMTSIMTTLRAAAQLDAVLCNDIDNLSLPLVTPAENSVVSIGGV